jgi:hypothetical protein
VLAGEDVDMSPEDRAALAQELYREARYALSVRMFTQAFAEDRNLEADLAAGHRYNAACSAALAGGVWRSQAVAWLRADLALRRAQLETDPAAVERTMAHWKKDADLASLRDTEDRPDDWKTLWTEVEALLARARESAK